MKMTSPKTWFQSLGLLARQPAKRISISKQRWGYQTECLEDRALLSAASVAPDTTPADVATANARAAVQYPQVSGSWDVEVAGLGVGTATFVQRNARVVATVDIPGVGEIKLRGRFSRDNPTEFVSNTRVKLPEIGRVKLHTEVNFPNETNPTTFTGTSVGGQLNLVLTGTKNVPTLSSDSSVGRAVVARPDVSGPWSVTVSQSDIGTLSGVLNITQSGRTGQVIRGTVDTPVDVTFKLTGRFKVGDTDVIKGVAVLKVPGEPAVRARFTVTLNDDASAFTGTAVVRQLGTVNITGTAGIVPPI